MVTRTISGSVTIDGVVYNATKDITVNLLSSPASIVTYAKPSGLPDQTQYTVTLNSTSGVYCYTSMEGKIVNFSMGAGYVHVIVDCDVDVTTYVVRPLRKSVTVSKTGARRIEFDISSTGQYSVEINGNIDTPLFVFANPLEITPPTATVGLYKYIGPGVWTVTGASTITSGSSTPSTGEYVIPADGGLYLAGGAYLRGKVRMGGSSTTSAMTANFQLTGRGIIDATMIPGDGTATTTANGYTGSRALRIQRATNVLVEGITVLNQVHWAFVCYESQDIVYDNIKSFNSRSVTDIGTPDGMDVVGCERVHIKNSFSHAYDDGIAVKTDKNGFSADTDNVLIENCVIFNQLAGHGLQVGYENNSDHMRNVTFRSCDIIHKANRPTGPTDRSALGVQVVDGATINNILFEDIIIEDCAGHFFAMNNQKSGSSVVSGGAPAEVYSVRFKDCRVIGGASNLPSEIIGNDATHPIKDVTFENCSIMGTVLTDANAISSSFGRFTLTNTSNIRFTPSATRLNPVANTYVVNDGTNSVNNTQLLTRNSATNTLDTKAFLRFDLTGLTISTVTQAVFRIYLAANANLSPVTLSVYPVTNDTWSESITYLTAPTNGSALISKSVNLAGGYYEWDITSHVATAYAANDKLISLLLFDGAVSGNLLTFNSGRATSDKPELLVA